MRDKLAKLPPVLISPILRIEYDTCPDTDGYETLIFTSQHGVIAAGDGVGRSCYTLGPQTTQQAKHAGFQVTQAGGDAKSLIQRILTDAPKGKLLHLRGDHSLGDVAQNLMATGLRCDEAVVYHQCQQKLSAEAETLLAGDQGVIVPIFSPRSALLIALHHKGTAPLYLAALSVQVAAAAQDLPLKGCEIASQPDALSMVAAIERLLDAGQWLEGVNPER